MLGGHTAPGIISTEGGTLDALEQLRRVGRRRLRDLEPRHQLGGEGVERGARRAGRDAVQRLGDRPRQQRACTARQQPPRRLGQVEVPHHLQVDRERASAHVAQQAEAGRRVHGGDGLLERVREGGVHALQPLVQLLELLEDGRAHLGRNTSRRGVAGGGRSLRACGTLPGAPTGRSK